MQCPKCKKETVHHHMHSTAHGIDGTHMAGSENYTCDDCGYKMFKSEGEKQGLKYVLD